MKEPDFKEWVTSHQDEIVAVTQNLLQIRSVGGERTSPNAPFGDGCREALNYMLSLGERCGFKTQDFEGYAGHIEFGEGKDYIAVLAHLDV